MSLTSKLTAVCCTAAIVGLTVALPGEAARDATTVTVTAGKASEFGFRLSTKTVEH